jgi:hypothetical protein
LEWDTAPPSGCSPTSLLCCGGLTAQDGAVQEDFLEKVPKQRPRHRRCGWRGGPSQEKYGIGGAAVALSAATLVWLPVPYRRDEAGDTGWLGAVGILPSLAYPPCVPKQYPGGRA